MGLVVLVPEHLEGFAQAAAVPLPEHKDMQELPPLVEDRIDLVDPVLADAAEPAAARTALSVHFL